jgi:hypothetical protein
MDKMKINYSLLFSSLSFLLINREKRKIKSERNK